MVRPRRVRLPALVAAVCALGLTAAGCQEDSPEQEVPPGIFTTTLGDVPPTTAAAPPAGPAGY